MDYSRIRYVVMLVCSGKLWSVIDRVLNLLEATIGPFKITEKSNTRCPRAGPDLLRPIASTPYLWRAPTLNAVHVFVAPETLCRLLCAK